MYNNQFNVKWKEIVYSCINKIRKKAMKHFMAKEKEIAENLKSTFKNVVSMHHPNSSGKTTSFFNFTFLYNRQIKS